MGRTRRMKPRENTASRADASSLRGLHRQFASGIMPKFNR